MTEPETLDALDQFHAKHLILFEGVDAPGVKDAFEQYAAQGKGKIHSAKITGPDKPGHFEFTSEQVSGWDSQPVLSNPENGNCVSESTVQVHLRLVRLHLFSMHLNLTLFS